MNRNGAHRSGRAVVELFGMDRIGLDSRGMAVADRIGLERNVTQGSGS